MFRSLSWIDPCKLHSYSFLPSFALQIVNKYIKHQTLYRTFKHPAPNPLPFLFFFCLLFFNSWQYFASISCLLNYCYGFWTPSNQLPYTEGEMIHLKFLGQILSSDLAHLYQYIGLEKWLIFLALDPIPAVWSLTWTGLTQAETYRFMFTYAPLHGHCTSSPMFIFKHILGNILGIKVNKYFKF